MSVSINNRAGHHGRKNGIIEYSEGVYEGEILGGNPHGKGTFKDANGSEQKARQRHVQGC